MKLQFARTLLAANLGPRAMPIIIWRCHILKFSLKIKLVSIIIIPPKVLLLSNSAKHYNIKGFLNICLNKREIWMVNLKIYILKNSLMNTSLNHSFGNFENRWGEINIWQCVKMTWQERPLRLQCLHTVI